MSYADSQMYDSISPPFQLKQYSETYSTNLFPPAPQDGYAMHPGVQPPQPTPQSGLAARHSGLHGDDFHLRDQEYSLRSTSQPMHAAYQPPTSSFRHNVQASVPSQSRDVTHGWDRPFEHTLGNRSPRNIAAAYASLPSPSPYPAPRLSPPLPSQLNGGSQQHNNSHMPLAGSFDPSTGIFYRTPEHPRLRTAQACEKCRTRKAKCSGEHPSCKRCINRGLVCEYAKEGRVRGPNKVKSRSGTLSDDSRIASRGRTASSNETADIEQPGFPDMKVMQLYDRRMSLPTQLTPRRHSLSLGETRNERPRLPDLRIEVTSDHYREGPQSGEPDMGGGAHCQPPAENIHRNAQLDNRHGFSIEPSPCQAGSIGTYYGHVPAVTWRNDTN
ncbi:hypothetical protein BD779DRAFT_793751 [Infundibulicybe gibba]|nr:hypothetical protein BD779DRAFT_793751 [Infundibulicybe gibba]